MRPIANFTFHAILAAALAALAASSAAAAPPRLASGEVFVKLPGAADAGGGEIELQSYSFGTSRLVTVADASKALNESRHRSDASAGKGASNEKMQPGGGSAQGSGVQRLFVKSWSTSGDASGERTHKPLRARMVYDGGSVTLTGRFPACRVGAAYPSAAIGHGNDRYEMQDAVVTTCSSEGITLNFKKVTVRGWDPKKKED